MSTPKDIHLNRNDFTVEWFSGSGGGGQHRNKHANCCRIRHPAMGLSAQRFFQFVQIAVDEGQQHFTNYVDLPT